MSITEVGHTHTNTQGGSSQISFFLWQRDILPLSFACLAPDRGGWVLRSQEARGRWIHIAEDRIRITGLCRRE